MTTMEVRKWRNNPVGQKAGVKQKMSELRETRFRKGTSRRSREGVGNAPTTQEKLEKNTTKTTPSTS